MESGISVGVPVKDTSDVVSVYERLMKIGSGDVWWAATRALTIKWAASVQWPDPVLEIGGQNGIVADLIGRNIDIMVDKEPDIRDWGKVYGKVIKGKSLPPGRFGTILALNVIYHMNSRKFLSEAYNRLETGGILIITDTPYYCDILTWPYLISQRFLFKMANKWTKKELSRHKVRVNQKMMIDIGNKWKVVTQKLYAGYEMCLLARAQYTIRYHSANKYESVPDIKGIFDEAMAMSLQCGRIPSLLASDDNTNDGIFRNDNTNDGIFRNDNTNDGIFRFTVLKKL